MPSLRRAQTHELGPGELRELRRLMHYAFDGSFGDTDWASSLGGTHVIVEDDDLVISHASVVSRRLLIDDREVSTGYVEAVATRPGHQRRRHATRVLEEVSLVIHGSYDIGALSTGIPDLYARLGWELWQGPTFVSTPDGRVRTEDDDGGIMVLRTPQTGTIDLAAPITCDWREGDVW